MEIVIKKITPATIESNIEELDTYITEIKNKYSSVIVTEELVSEGKEERAKLNKLKKNLGEIRKKVEKDGLSDVQKFILKLKEAEKVVDNLSDDINSQIKSFEEKEKKEKLDWIKATIDVETSNNSNFKNAKKFIIHNPKWLNKTFSFDNIKKEILEQINKLNEKYNFIKAQLEAANEEIENKIVFEDIEHIFECSYDEILKYIIKKKNEIKVTEENMKKKAEEDKQRAIKEAEEKAEKEKQAAVEKAKNEERKKIEDESKKDLICKELDVDTAEYDPSRYDEQSLGFAFNRDIVNVSAEDRKNNVLLMIKIQKSDVETAVLLKKFLDDNKIEYKKI